MSLIDNIKRDRDAGTPGPWAQSHREKPSGGYATEVYQPDDPDNTIATIHWHSIPTGTGFRTDRGELARRIARVPQLEAIALAAMDLADAAETVCDKCEHPEAGVTILDEKRLRAALTAFRSALAEKETDNA